MALLSGVMEMRGSSGKLQYFTHNIYQLIPSGNGNTKKIFSTMIMVFSHN